MTTAEIISVIRIAFKGREFVGRIGIIRENGNWDVVARVRNANGEGIRHEVLCSLDSCALAVDVQRHLKLGLL